MAQHIWWTKIAESFYMHCSLALICPVLCHYGIEVFIARTLQLFLWAYNWKTVLSLLWVHCKRQNIVMKFDIMVSVHGVFCFATVTWTNSQWVNKCNSCNRKQSINLCDFSLQANYTVVRSVGNRKQAALINVSIFL